MLVKKSHSFSLALSVLVHALLLAGVMGTHLVSQDKLSFAQKDSSQSIQRTRIYVRKSEPQREIKKPASKKTRKELPRPLSKKVARSNSRPSEEALKEIRHTQGKNSELARYLNLVRNLIATHKKYPRVAKRLKQEGAVHISFEIEWPNVIKNIHLVEKSSHDVLNTSAFRLVQNLQDIPEIPKQLKVKIVKVSIPIVYKLL